MRFTAKTDYCLRVLIYLQTYTGKTRIKDIAEAYGISKNHLSVAVNRLSELGYILSTPGPKGGIEFNPKVADETVGNLVSRLEDFEIVECFNPELNTCNLDPKCRLKKMIRGATNSFIAELKKYKVKDLA